MKKITVLLADDHSLVREGLQALLQAESDITVVGQAETGVDAVKLATRLRPDVIVMDIAMPLLNGVEATRQILEKVPKTHILVLSAYSNPNCIEQVLTQGAMGYLIKKSSIHILAQAIRQVHKGKRFFDPSIDASTLPDPSKKKAKDLQHDTRGAALSARETEVLILIVQGLLNKQIAAELGISAKTSEKHRYSLMEKLNIHDTAGLTQYAIASGLTEKQ
jgi:DNA-binding NarL/FixJ family response regulator